MATNEQLEENRINYIDIDSIVDGMLERIEEINETEWTQSRKTNEFIKLATSIKNQLHDDERKKKRIALSTYKRYLTRVRRAIKKAGYTHHSLSVTRANKNTVAYAIKHFPEYAELLEGLRQQPALTIGAYRNDILEQIKADKKANPDKSPKHYNDAYHAVKSIKIDHEVINHLTLTGMQKDELKEAATEALNKKKNNVIRISHEKVLGIINSNLDGKSYASRALALALASGRRAIELFDKGSFTFVDNNKVLFDGQAKKQEGIDAPAYEIYTLIPAQEFIAAFEAFKKTIPDFSDIDTDDEKERNELINLKIAKPLSTAAKRIFDDSDRVFKDSRSIYARVCIETFHKTDPKWRTKDEDVFAEQLLGHADGFEAVAAYKSVILADDLPEEVEEVQSPQPEAPTSKEPAQELLAITPLLDSESNAMKKFHARVIEWYAARPDVEITQTSITKGRDGSKVGGSRPMIKRYLENAKIKALIEAYNTTINN